MQKKLILHLGGPKTGTSALQSFLARNSELLLEKGLEYPALSDLGRAEKGEISSGNGIGIALHFLEPGAHKGAKAFPKFQQLLRTSEAPTILFSSEHFTFVKPSAIAQIRSEAENVGRKLELITYIRPQIEFIISNYAQSIKRHCETDSIANYWENSKRVFDPLPRLKGFESTVERDHLKVRLYFRKEFNGGDIIDDFGHQLGLDFSDPAFERFKHAINPTPGPHELALLRYLNRFKRVEYESGISDSLLGIMRDDKLSDNSDTRPWLSEAFAQKICDHYELSNIEISKRYLTGSPISADLGKPECYLALDELPDPGPETQAMAKLFLSLFRTVHQQQQTINQLRQPKA